MINSHIHLIPEDLEQYAETLAARMKEHGVRAAVVFGAQCEQAASDIETKRIALSRPDVFIPFLSRSADIASTGAFNVCVQELETGFWKGVGEIFLDSTDDPFVRWIDRNGKERCITKAVPEEAERHPLYQALFNYCGAHNLPVLVHCKVSDVMARTLAAFPGTTFIWAHVDHGFYDDVAIRLLGSHPNLVCEFGAEFRFHSGEIVSGQAKRWLRDHMERWRRTCKGFPDRVIWGTDLFSWNDLEPANFATDMEVFQFVFQGLDEDTRQKVTDGNIARLLGLN